MVPSPPNKKITSAWSPVSGSPRLHSIVLSVWKGLRSLAEHPSPRMAAARMRGESSRIHRTELLLLHYVGTAALGCPAERSSGVRPCSVVQTDSRKVFSRARDSLATLQSTLAAQGFPASIGFWRRGSPTNAAHDQKTQAARPVPCG